MNWVPLWRVLKAAKQLHAYKRPNNYFQDTDVLSVLPKQPFPVRRTLPYIHAIIKWTVPTLKSDWMNHVWSHCRIANRNNSILDREWLVLSVIIGNSAWTLCNRQAKFCFSWLSNAKLKKCKPFSSIGPKSIITSRYYDVLLCSALHCIVFVYWDKSSLQSLWTRRHHDQGQGMWQDQCTASQTLASCLMQHPTNTERMPL